MNNFTPLFSKTVSHCIFLNNFSFYAFMSVPSSVHSFISKYHFFVSAQKIVWFKTKKKSKWFTFHLLPDKHRFCRHSTKNTGDNSEENRSPNQNKSWSVFKQVFWIRLWDHDVYDDTDNSAYTWRAKNSIIPDTDGYLKWYQLTNFSRLILPASSNQLYCCWFSFARKTNERVNCVVCSSTNKDHISIKLSFIWKCF